jgi:hypothetical protein
MAVYARHGLVPPTKSAPVRAFIDPLARQEPVLAEACRAALMHEEDAYLVSCLVVATVERHLVSRLMA